MAAPTEITLEDISGKWVMNKTLSGDVDSTLTLQGVGWLTRKAIGLATVTLHIKHFKGEEGSIHIDIDQVATGGVKGTHEARVLDNQWRAHSDHIFGELKGRSRCLKLTEIKADDLEDQKHLVEGWRDEIEEVIESFVENEKGRWTAWQTWGFEDFNGERRYVRHVVVRKGEEVKRIKLVYDFLGKR